MPIRYREVHGLRKDGSEFPLEIRFTRATAGDEQLFVAAARDISERVAARDEIERLNAELQVERDRLREEVHGLRDEVSQYRKLGQFTLQEQIGAGGMGEVWLASHRMLARPAAVKLIRPERLDSSPAGAGEILTRFEREAQVTASLKSPHSVSLYDFGVDDDGVFYYVMELFDGLDLETLVRGHGAIPPERVTYLLSQACHSLCEAHDVGLIHRDIKPANLYTCRYGNDYDFVKLLDFGLVTLQPEWSDEANRLTGEGNVLGTPAYMAPEVAVSSAEVDGRADLYALGCVAYYLLTGTPVFDERAPVAMLLAHVQNQPEPPSKRAPNIPSALEALVLDCLKKEPSERPATAEELRDRLAAIRFEEPWSSNRAREWWGRHWTRPAAASNPLSSSAEVPTLVR